MTRYLSDALQAAEPSFRLSLRRLESAHNNPNTDIRFSTEILHITHAKLRELALDPHDTTANELYQALLQRLKTDDSRLTRHLRAQAATHVSAEAEVVAGMVHVIKQLPESKRCFGLKSSSLKALLKKNPPKKAMKQLGYRSLDSLLKHEAPAAIVAAAILTDGSAWHRRLLEQYKKLQSNDFEERQIQLLHPASPRWRQLAQSAVGEKGHNLVASRELGAITFLPLPDTVPAGAVTASICLALHELNEMRAASSFLKLSLVRADFGQVVKTVASGKSDLSATLLDQPVPWHLVQRYYSRAGERFNEAIFEPYIERIDMVWHDIEDTLASIESSFSFWHQTAHLGRLDKHRAVSFNILDVALNLCNQIPYEKRIINYFQQSLWHELLLRYLQHQPIEQTVLAELQPQLAAETVLA